MPPEPLLPELDPPLPDPLAAALMPQPNTVRAARPRPSLRNLRLVSFDRLVTQIDHRILIDVRTDVGRLINNSRNDFSASRWYSREIQDLCAL